MEKPVTLALTGDVMLGRLMNKAFQQFGPAHPWGNMLPLLREPGLTIANLECVIAATGQKWSRWNKVFHFRAHPVAISALKLAGIDCVSIANNHVLDYEEEALLEMLDLLDQNGIAHAGAGRNLEEAQRPVVLEAQGLRVGVVACTDNEPRWAATANSPGTNWITISVGEPSLAPVREAISQARAAGADLVLFSIHWGPNMVQRPSPLCREFARAVIESGADIFYGHSAHIFQGVELYCGRPIFYDTGDFIDDYAVDPELRNDWGLLFRVNVSRTGVGKIELIPVFIAKCQVNLAVGPVREAIGERIKSLSAEMGTEVRQDGERLWIGESSDASLLPL